MLHEAQQDTIFVKLEDQNESKFTKKSTKLLKSALWSNSKASKSF